ncbi:Tmem245, partial [Symbiodinium necroappetens]
MEATSPVQDAEGETLEVIKQQLEDLRSQNEGQAAALRELQEGVGKFVRLDDRPSVIEGPRSDGGLVESLHAASEAVQTWTQSWESSMDSKDQAFARLAFIFLVVNVAGGLVLTAFYYNFTAFEVYIMSLFWAGIISIPLYQVKISIIDLIFSLTLRETYRLTRVLETNPPQDRILVMVSKLPRFHWLHVDEPESTERQQEFKAFLDEELMSSSALRRNIEEKGKEYHVSLRSSASARGTHKRRDQIEEIWERRHWLGTLRPYSDAWDIFRDLPMLWASLRFLLGFLTRPLSQFSTEADSAPYFGLLLRLCATQLCFQTLSRDDLAALLTHAVRAYGIVVLLRLVITGIGYLPALLQLAKVPEPQRKDWRERCEACCAWLRRCGRALAVRLDEPLAKCMASFRENCHFLLSMLIIIAALVFTLNFVSFLTIALRREAVVIAGTLQELMRQHEAYQALMQKVASLAKQTGVGPTQDVSGLVLAVRSQIEAALPNLEKVLAQHIPNFQAFKYVLYDAWNDNDSDGWLDGATSASLDMQKTCEDAIAVGASCGPGLDKSLPMKQMLQNTTAVLRHLAGGNVSGAASLLPFVYSEVAAVSSMMGLGEGGAQQSSAAEALKDGAAYGGTLLAKFTYNVPLALLDTLASASSLLGQAVVFVTALFYLLSAKESCLAVVGEFLRVIDQKQVIFRISERVMRAVLVSAMKMSAFHALFTWLLYSFGELPIIVVPTVLSAVLALVPKVSPVWSVSIWATVYLWWQGDKAWAIVYGALNFAVWFQVPTVIYAEIPESNAWLTGLGVVLGVGQFGLAGVVLGPLLASVPLICFNLVKLFNTDKMEWRAAEGDLRNFGTRSRRGEAHGGFAFSVQHRPSLLTLHQSFLQDQPSSDSEDGPNSPTSTSAFDVAELTETQADEDEQRQSQSDRAQASRTLVKDSPKSSASAQGVLSQSSSPEQASSN